jgi:hypothetical protein
MPQIYTSYLNYDAWRLIADPADPMPKLISMSPEVTFIRSVGRLVSKVIGPVSGSIDAARSLLNIVKSLSYNVAIETLSNTLMNTDISYIHLPIGEDA